MSGVNEANFNDTKPILVETIASTTNTTTEQVDAVFIGMVSSSSRRDVEDKAEINVTVIPNDENEQTIVSDLVNNSTEFKTALNTELTKSNVTVEETSQVELLQGKWVVNIYDESTNFFYTIMILYQTTFIGSIVC